MYKFNSQSMESPNLCDVHSRLKNIQVCRDEPSNLILLGDFGMFYRWTAC